VGHVTGVEITGTGGTYNFSKGGVFDIEPGDYTISVKGNLVLKVSPNAINAGDIEALIEYE
jgi:hypothetical protein